MLTFTLSPLAGWTAGIWHGTNADPQPLKRPHPQITQPATPVGDDGWSNLPYPLLDDPDADVLRDRYGNDVSTAVATYKSDRSGGVYEEHSPNTQVARLKPPTT